MDGQIGRQTDREQDSQQQILIHNIAHPFSHLFRIPLDETINRFPRGAIRQSHTPRRAGGVAWGEGRVVWGGERGWGSGLGRGMVREEGQLPFVFLTSSTRSNKIISCPLPHSLPPGIGRGVQGREVGGWERKPLFECVGDVMSHTRIPIHCYRLEAFVGYTGDFFSFFLLWCSSYVQTAKTKNSGGEKQIRIEAVTGRHFSLHRQHQRETGSLRRVYVISVKQHVTHTHTLFTVQLTFRPKLECASHVCSLHLNKHKNLLGKVQRRTTKMVGQPEK